MELILWRHASRAGRAHLGRRLSSKEEKQARRIAEWLHGRCGPARILVSPATRAQQTAQALADLSRRKFKTLEQDRAGLHRRGAVTPSAARIPIPDRGRRPPATRVWSRAG